MQLEKIAANTVTAGSRRAIANAPVTGLIVFLLLLLLLQLCLPVVVVVCCLRFLSG